MIALLGVFLATIQAAHLEALEQVIEEVEHNPHKYKKDLDEEELKLAFKEQGGELGYEPNFLSMDDLKDMANLQKKKNQAQSKELESLVLELEHDVEELKEISATEIGAIQLELTKMEELLDQIDWETLENPHMEKLLGILGDLREGYREEIFAHRISTMQRRLWARKYLDYVWMGNLRSDSISIKVKLKEKGRSVGMRMRLFRKGRLALSLPMETRAGVSSVRIMHKLLPSSEYTGEVVLNGGKVVAGEVSFRTPAEEGTAYSFQLAFGSCSDNDSSSLIYQHIANHRPLFLLHMGDMHYGNIGYADSEAAYASMFGRALRKPPQQAMYSTTPVAYMWDDHDYGPNNSDRSCPCRVSLSRQ